MAVPTEELRPGRVFPFRRERPSLPPRSWAELAPVMVLAGAATLWAAVFIVLGWQRHDRFATFGFDLGIYDQGIWLVSRLKDPFVTVRGLDLFGHHMNVALLLFAPFYRLGAGPEFLLVVQVVVQASGALAVYLLARDLLGERWLAVALGVVLLLHPTYQFLTWEYFHPDALAIAPLLFAYWAARARRWRWFALCALLAMACKEDVALAVAMVGLLIAVRGDRRVGVVTSALATAWFFVATRALIPAFNGIGPFYDTFFGDFGSSAGEVAANVARHPGKALRVATRPDRITYYRMMLAPVAFLPLAALPTLLVGAPMLAVNALSSFPYVREIKYHYASLVVAAIILATVEAVARLGFKPGLRRFLVGLVAATSLAASVAWGPSPMSTQYRKGGYWPLGHDRRLAAKRAATALVPPEAPTSASYLFVPHLAHRERIYEFPVPWKNVNWGVRGENLHDPARVRWIVIDRHLVSGDDQPLLDRLLAEEFQVRQERDDILVAQRVRPPVR